MKQPSSSAKNSNAISLLKSDHRMVEDLFKQIESTRDDVELAELVVALQTALSVHTRIEEEVFYPALRASVSKAGDLLDEAAVEHGSAKHFLIDLSTSTNDDRFYRARLKVLKEHINHHVKEEEEKDDEETKEEETEEEDEKDEEEKDKEDEKEEEEKEKEEETQEE